MDRYGKIARAIREQTRLLQLLESGCSPGEVKQAVIDTLSPYVHSRSFLEEHAVDVLIPVSVNLLQMQQEPWVFAEFERCLAVYRGAKLRSRAECFNACSAWETHIAEAVSKFWSALHLEQDKGQLEIDEFLHESLKNIGELIEAAIRPRLGILLHQSYIREGKTRSLEHILAMDLGALVNELMQATDCTQLLAPPPWGIRLNQWRNIAYHHTAHVREGIILCSYGRQPKMTNVEFSRDEFLDVSRTIAQLIAPLEVSRTLFCLDNMEDIQPLFSTQPTMRIEAQFLSFANGLASQGFEVIDFAVTSEQARLVVREVLPAPDRHTRWAHASQFVYPLWEMTRAQQLAVEYRNTDGNSEFLTTIDSSVCERISRGDADVHELATKARWINLLTGLELPKTGN